MESGLPSGGMGMESVSRPLSDSGTVSRLVSPSVWTVDWVDGESGDDGEGVWRGGVESD